jgi:DNA-binding transcriptional regulator YhcF (GntR family)
MIPEKELVRRTFILRDMRFPNDTKLTKSSLVRWLCLSLGLLSEDETRQTILPIMDSFIHLQLVEKKNPTTRELAERAEVPEKAVRYHLHRLRVIGLVEESGRKYRFIRDSTSNELSLSKAFKENYRSDLEKTARNVESALSEIQRAYNPGLTPPFSPKKQL